MKKILVLFTTVLATTIANAVPNFWNLQIAQGSYIYKISDTKNSSLEISCYLGSEIPRYQELKVTHKSKTIQNTNKNTPLSFVIDDKQSFQPLLKSGTYGDSREWNEFLTKLPKAKKIEVYRDNQFLFTVKPRNRGGEDISTVDGCYIN